MLCREILANDTHQVDGFGKIGCGDGGIGCRSSEQVGSFGSGGFDVVDGDGAADDDGHEGGMVSVGIRLQPEWERQAREAGESKVGIQLEKPMIGNNP